MSCISSQCFITIKSICIVLLLSITCGAVSANSNYGEALTKSLLYFEAQRSGKLPLDQRVIWRGDSALRDGSDAHVDLTGGYYDAGDNMKFGFPLAFTTTMLAWSSVEMESQLKAHQEHGNTLAALRWATDYLIKAHPEPNVLYGQVGDANLDHACWMRPEDMTTPRPSYRIDPQHPGADLAGETAAAMAAASLAFAPSDSAYAKTLISHAKELFEFAKDYPGVYHNSIPNAGGFYPSSGYEDELLWAAAWLHRATGDQTYLDHLTQASNSGGARSVFAWDDKFLGAQVLVAKLVFEGKVKNEGKMIEYKSMAEQFICNCAQKGFNNVKKTPGGLLWFLPWDNLQYTATASFALATYAKYLEAAQTSIQCPNGDVLQASDLLNLARAQVRQAFVFFPFKLNYVLRILKT
ncbi:glycosyl hydrolase 9B12 [Arabidopsis thaliana]|uniref:cellulase n=2 Tax=Arabidopsis thaliana TaxID=3702 RepID=A0A1P8AYH8_ARATH|nr:glycosyl hydrolase 9B12 [Arabidopsis thaliana]ANM61708.1 glycosyl hydrolase 9B12 [Arabidopsis thaliana]|eukprot:NP_001323910.1 glycosyl hydrolase 9B12 [Arabidopsis thaliana]